MSDTELKLRLQEPNVGRNVPGFDERMALHYKLLEELQKGNEHNFWSREGGNYGVTPLVSIQPSFPEPIDSKKPFEPEKLGGMESYFRDLIHQYLQKEPQRPVIAVDIGGMTALSWCKLANHFRQEVLQGKVVFAVTNLAMDPEKVFEKIGSGMTPQENFIKGCHDAKLIHFIQADSSKYRNTEIITPTGQQISLYKHADIVHESMSLSYYTQIPEIEIPRVADLVSDRGIYFVDYQPNPSGYQLNMTNVPVPDKPENIRQRGEALKIAHEILVDRGMVKLREIEDGTEAGRHMQYIAFKNPQAPKISLSSS